MLCGPFHDRDASWFQTRGGSGLPDADATEARGSCRWVGSGLSESEWSTMRPPYEHRPEPDQFPDEDVRAPLADEALQSGLPQQLEELGDEVERIEAGVREQDQDISGASECASRHRSGRGRLSAVGLACCSTTRPSEGSSRSSSRW